MRLEGKVALVTGAGQGIGRAVAITFAKEGTDIVVNDIDLKLAEKVADQIKSLGRQALAVKADVSKSSDVNQMVEQALNNFGRIDILVNNAGICRLVPVVELTETMWDMIMDTNIKGVFLCCQTIGKQMIKQGYGKIVNIASEAGHETAPDRATYSVSKSGVLQLTKVLAVEWADYNINVNSVSPGVTETEMLKEALKGDPNYLKIRLRSIPQRRLNKPEDVANVVLFLASSESNNITGQDIRIDGGISVLMAGYGWPERTD